ncbi:MAG: septal ring lytic transglycosylase RlpA family protein [Treponema sp.]|jgi:rare lipoprotein A|nr:septal ring lytic transglycosylase RlpA family protein [Treponema sp.]
MKRIIPLVCTGLILGSLCIPRDAEAQVQPAPEEKIFRQEGIASWYGTEFDGRPTASGEIFNSTLFTAAHPTLPFGTVLTVTNKHNNKKVTVKVNDRGPFVSARIIDISKMAAEQLDMLVTGTAPVLIESTKPVAVADPAPAGTRPAPDPLWTLPPEQPAPGEPPPPPTAFPPVRRQPEQPAASSASLSPAEMTPEIPALPAPSYGPAALIPAINPVPGKVYRLQIGSYKVARNAVDSFDKLKGRGLSPSYERYEEYFRVVLAGVRGEEVQLLQEKIGAAGFREALIREER